MIGGGPAGLEAARTAALRGHEVTICEKGTELGGQWILASLPPKKQEYREMIQYYVRELEKLNVRVELSRAVTPHFIEQANPDVCVVATGAVPIIPEIAGVNRKNIVTAHDALRGQVSIGDKVAVLGGGEVGCETADYLADQGKEVTIIEMLEEIAKDVSPLRKPFLMQRLVARGVKILTSAKVEEITEGGIIAMDKNRQKRNVGFYATIVLALGAKSLNEIAKQIEDKVPKVFVIGDALEPRKALDAIAEGALVGREI